MATKHGHLEIVRLIVETGVDKSPLFKGETPLDLVKPRSCYRFYKLLITNCSQFWYRFACDIAMTIIFFIFHFMMIMGPWVLVLLLVWSIFQAEGAKIPEQILMTIVTVPCTIALLIVAISWVYLSGCIHKYVKKYYFWVESYLACIYE